MNQTARMSEIQTSEIRTSEIWTSEIRTSEIRTQKRSVSQTECSVFGQLLYLTPGPRGGVMGGGRFAWLAQLDAKCYLFAEKPNFKSTCKIGGGVFRFGCFRPITGTFANSTLAQTTQHHNCRTLSLQKELNLSFMDLVNLTCCHAFVSLSSILVLREVWCLCLKWLLH